MNVPMKKTYETRWEAGFEPHEDGLRGFDHGVFVPLKLAFPDASIPTVALSLLSSLNPQVTLQ